MKEIDFSEISNVETGSFLKGTVIADDDIVGILDIDAIVKMIREQA